MGALVEKNNRVIQHLRATILSVLLVLVLLISSCKFNGQFISNNGNNVQLEKNEIVDASNLLRLISICLKDIDQTDAIYNSIASEQLDGMSLSNFRLYIEVIIKMGADRGELQNFQILHGQNRSEIQQLLINQSPDNENLIDISVPVVLIYDNNLDQEPVLFYFQENEEGMPYLSNEWVDYCLNLYHFSVHYFSAVMNNNQNALYSLVEDSYLDMAYVLSKETILLKVRQTARYYLTHVKSEVEEYTIRSLDVSEIVFEQPEVLSEEMEESYTRLVRFYYNPRGTISVDDRIENTVLVRDLYLFYQGSRTVRIGDMATQSYFDSLFGQPVMTTIGQELGITYDEVGEPRVVRQFIVDYGATIFTVIGQINANGEWEGSIVKISISGQADEVSLGRVLRTGMSRDAVMDIYPFADQTDYIIAKQMDDQLFNLEINFSGDQDDVVSEINLEWSEHSLYN